jgi:hypothetical protein
LLLQKVPCKGKIMNRDFFKPEYEYACAVNAQHVHNIISSDSVTCITVDAVDICVILNNDTMYEFNLSDYRLNCFHRGLTPRF